MYRIDHDKGVLEICFDGKPVLSGVTPVVRFDSEKSIQLVFEEFTESPGDCEFDQYTFKYANQEKDTFLTLIITAKGSALSFCIKAERVNPWYQKSERFDRDKGVGLVFKPSKYTGNILSIAKANKWWTHPVFCREIGNIPDETQSLLWGYENQYVFLMGVSDQIFKSEFSAEGEAVSVYITHGGGGYAQAETACFALGVSDDPFGLFKDVIGEGLSIAQAPAKTRESKKFPDMLEYLGWCSWDAFYTDVSEQGLMEKAREFQNLKLPVKWFILDDGWQRLSNCTLMELRENREKFPQGLKKTVESLKKDYGFQWAGIWHAMLGHWNGIVPGSQCHDETRELLITTSDGSLIPNPEEGSAFKYFSRLHSYIAACGFDFIKVDGQSFLADFIKDDLKLGQAARAMQKALDASAAIYFNGCMINCMGMALEQVYSRPSSTLSRNSNDFFPNEKNNFRQHALHNAYNAVTHGQVYWTDWDMFWTTHTHSANNSLLRAVSGGPVYTSDRVGTTDPNYLWPLILRDGKILRADQPGLPTADCLLRNPNTEETPLKVWNRSGQAGILAAFNIHETGSMVKGDTGAADIPGLAGERFVAYEYYSGKATVIKKEERLPINLKEDEFALYLFIPLKKGFAAIGLVEKYLSCAAIKEQVRFNNKEMIILHEGGTFAFVSETAPRAVYLNGEPYTPDHQQGCYIVQCSHIQGNVWIEIEF